MLFSEINLKKSRDKQKPSQTHNNSQQQNQPIKHNEKRRRKFLEMQMSE